MHASAKPPDLPVTLTFDPLILKVDRFICLSRRCPSTTCVPICSEVVGKISCSRDCNGRTDGRTNETTDDSKHDGRSVLDWPRAGLWWLTFTLLQCRVAQRYSQYNNGLHVRPILVYCDIHVGHLL